MKDYGLPELNKLENDVAMRDLWLTQRSPGLTEMERLINLSILLRALGPPDQSAATIESLEKLAASKSLPTVVVYLREIADGE